MQNNDMPDIHRDSPVTSGGGPSVPEDFVPGPVHNEHVRRKWLDLSYADISPAQRLDIYLPNEGEGPFPVFVYVHGGAFAIGNKGDDQTDPYLVGLERGYAVVPMNYRMSGEALFPAAVEDVKGAIRWLRAHGAEYSFDTTRIAVGGQSAGGNLSAMAGLTAGSGLFEDPALGNSEYPGGVSAIVDQFGPTDFLKMDEQLRASGLGPANHSEADSPESMYLGVRITEIPELVRQADPMTYVHADMPPVLIQHGTADDQVPMQQSLEFAKVIEQKAGRERFELDLLEGEGHSTPGFWTRANMDRVFDFLDRHLK